MKILDYIPRITTRRVVMELDSDGYPLKELKDAESYKPAGDDYGYGTAVLIGFAHVQWCLWVKMDGVYNE